MDFPEKRQARRIRVNLPVTYEHLGIERHPGKTVTRDISLTGLRMNMPSFFPSDCPFLIKLNFTEVNRIIEGIAKIVWSQRISFSDQYQAGLRFSELNPLFKKWLEEYIIVNEALSR
ncbi:MAG: PilZ domain-containing protein [Candidatus Omnitrophica bacterium]|nr:PilZ domain-containing protein [Candidatus Omnitrophota bacterium]MDD5573862.1 PilZ domain-containing protein [Candidatus Omnitrophota bacterium]